MASLFSLFRLSPGLSLALLSLMWEMHGTCDVTKPICCLACFVGLNVNFVSFLYARRKPGISWYPQHTTVSPVQPLTSDLLKRNKPLSHLIFVIL